MNHKVFLLCISNIQNGEKHIADIKHIFDSVDFVFMKCKKPSRLKRFAQILTWNYGFNAKLKYPEVYRAFRSKLFKIISEKNIDAIHTHSLEMAQYCHNISSVPILLDLADCRSLEMKRNYLINETKLSILKRIYSKLLYYKMKKYEIKITNGVNVCTTVSSIDASFYKKLNPRINISAIPNGVDLSYFHPVNIEKEEKASIIFWGNMDFPPNFDAVLYFANSILPLVKNDIPDILFYVVGGSPTKEIKALSSSPNIIITGYVEDIRTWVAKSTISICPMRIGAGIKNKVLEAMAMQKAVVSTSIGAGGIHVSSGDNIIIADTPKEFADSVICLIRNKNTKTKIARAGRKLVENKHNWNTVSDSYELLYNRLNAASLRG